MNKSMFSTQYTMISWMMMLFMLLINIFSLLFSSTMHIWFLLEINFMFFIFFLMSMTPPNIKEIIIYFIPQTIASLMMIFIIMINNLKESILIDGWLLISISMKLGLFPFHFIPPMITMKLNWYSILSYSIFQKFIPLILINKFIENQMNPWFNWWILISCIVTICSSTINGIMFKNLKMIMTYSSINNSCWMIPLINSSKIYFIYFYLMYSIIMIMLILMMNSIKMEKLDKTLIYFFIFKKKYLLMFCILMFILAMIPPFTSFMIKMMSIKYLIYMNIHLMTYMLTILSTLSILMYMNMMIWMMMIMMTMPTYLIYTQTFKYLKMMTIFYISIIIITLSFNFSYYLLY